MKNYTDITVVLDRSGSMSSVWADTVGGFNNFLQKQKKIPSSAFSLMTFSDKAEWVYTDRAIAYATKLSSENYIPSGNTALYDAIGKAVNERGSYFAAKPAEERPSKVVFVIITDGHENASREFKSSHIKEMIEHQQQKYSWQFVFLGADQDAILASKDLGIWATHAMSYSNSHEGYAHMFDTVSSNVSAYAAGATMDCMFLPEQKTAAADIMVKEGKVKPTC